MKTLMKIMISAFLALSLFGCKQNEEMEQYSVTYNVYYSTSTVRRITHHTFLPAKHKNYCLVLSSFRGSNGLYIRRENKMPYSEEVISTTAPIEVVSYSDNFIKFIQ